MRSLGPRIPPSVVARVPLRQLARCGLFTLASINSLIVGSIIADHELTRKSNDHGREQYDNSFLPTFRWQRRPPSQQQPRTSPSAIIKTQIVDWLKSARDRIESLLGRPLNNKDWYWVIVSINLTVYLLNISPIGPKVLRYSTSTPYGPTPVRSMLLSIFSHHSLTHLAMNMYVLNTFFTPLMRLIGPTEFLALYLGGGIFGSFLSLISKAARRCPLPSLGASGSICTVLGATCLLEPSAKLCIPFLVDVVPHSFDASQAIWALLGFELMGASLLARFSPIDHAAHLGGLLYGMCYGNAGQEAIRDRKRTIVSWWQSLRSS